MGEAKRRKLLDPNHGKAKRFDKVYSTKLKDKLLTEIHSKPLFLDLAKVCMESHKAMLMEQMQDDGNGKGTYGITNLPYESLFGFLKDSSSNVVKQLIESYPNNLLVAYKEFNAPLLLFSYSPNEICQG